MSGSAPREHVFISPHPDDVVLSIGGLVAQCSRRGERAQVVTVCAGLPAGSAQGYMQARLDEDRAALAELGATQVLLPLLDAIYRQPAYATAQRLFGEPLASDGLTAELVVTLQTLSATLGPAVYYFPLAVGGHVDHQVVCSAGFQLAAAGFEVRFYEDLPYALRAGALASRVAAAALSQIVELHEVTADFPRKLRAAQAYRSQIAPLFGSEAAMFEGLLRYSLSLSEVGGRCVERLWRPLASSMRT